MNKTFSMFVFCGLIFVSSINVSLGMSHSSNVSLDEDTTEELPFSLLPLTIILENQLRAVKASKGYNSMQSKLEVLDKNLKFIAKTSDNAANNICSEMEIRKRVSAEEMAKILNGHVNFDNEMHLQKIYDSVRDCQFVKVGSSKLWGPLWHCLNRLFLFFVFG